MRILPQQSESALTTNYKPFDTLKSLLGDLKDRQRLNEDQKHTTCELQTKTTPSIHWEEVKGLRPG